MTTHKHAGFRASRPAPRVEEGGTLAPLFHIVVPAAPQIGWIPELAAAVVGQTLTLDMVESAVGTLEMIHHDIGTSEAHRPGGVIEEIEILEDGRARLGVRRL